MKREYVLPVAALLFSLALGVSVAVVTGNPWVIPAFFGEELYVMRCHAGRCPYHKSFLDSTPVAVFSLTLLSVSLSAGCHHSMSCFVSILALVFSSQLFLHGLHEQLHELGQPIKSDALLQMVAGLLVTAALAIALPWFHFMPLPPWQRWIV